MVRAQPQIAVREASRIDPGIGSPTHLPRACQLPVRPARIGCGWGESTIGVYRREERDGRDVLGEVPDHPIDPSVGVIRVDDVEGEPIAVVFRYSCHPVTMGPRSAVVQYAVHEKRTEPARDGTALRQLQRGAAFYPTRDVRAAPGSL